MLINMVVECSGEAPIAIPAAPEEGGVNLEGAPESGALASCDSLSTLVGVVTAAVTDGNFLLLFFFQSLALAPCLGSRKACIYVCVDANVLTIS